MNFAATAARAVAEEMHLRDWDPESHTRHPRLIRPGPFLAMPGNGALSELVHRRGLRLVRSC